MLDFEVGRSLLFLIFEDLSEKRRSNNEIVKARTKVKIGKRKKSEGEGPKPR